MASLEQTGWNGRGVQLAGQHQIKSESATEEWTPSSYKGTALPGAPEYREFLPENTHNFKRPSAYVDAGNEGGAEILPRDSKGRPLRAPTRPGWVSAGKLYSSVEKDSSLCDKMQQAQRDRRMATALDLARKAVTLDIPTYELTQPTRGAAGRHLHDGDAAELVPVGPIDPGPLSSLQLLVQTQKSGLGIDSNVPSSTRSGFVLRDPEEEIVDLPDEKVPGTNHDGSGERSCSSNVKAIHEASYISEGDPVQHNRLKKNVMECSPGMWDAATESSVYGCISEPPAVETDGEGPRQKAIRLVVQGLLRALNTSDGNSSTSNTADYLAQQMYRVARTKGNEGSSFVARDRLAEGRKGNREGVLASPREGLAYSGSHMATIIQGHDEKETQHGAADVPAELQRRDFLMESQLERIREMESRMSNLLDTLDINTSTGGNVVAVRSKEDRQPVHMVDLRLCMQALDDIEQQEQAIRDRWMSAGSRVRVPESKAPVPMFSKDWVREGPMQTSLDGTGLAVATVSVNVCKPQNQAKHHHANASVSNPQSRPSDESLASIKNYRKQFMTRQTQMQGDVLSHADPDFSFLKAANVVSDLLVDDILLELSAEMSHFCDGFAETLFEYEFYTKS